LSFASEINSQ